MFYNIAYPLSQSPHGGMYKPLDESYIEYEKLLDERLKKQRREFEEKRRKEQDREFRNFWRNFDPFFDEISELSRSFTHSGAIFSNLSHLGQFWS